MQQIKVFCFKLWRPVLYALVDDADYEFLNKFEWYQRRNGNGLIYARTNVEGKYIDMHQMILPCPIGYTPDHKNGNSLDNQRDNLRIANKSQQGANRGKARSGGYSKYKGVSYDKRRKKFKAELMCRGIRENLGSFKSEIDAAKAYNEAAFKAFGEFAKLNQI